MAFELWTGEASIIQVRTVLLHGFRLPSKQPQLRYLLLFIKPRWGRDQLFILSNFASRGADQRRNWYSRNWRRERYPIHKELETWSSSDTQGIAGDAIVIRYTRNRWRHDCYPILNNSLASGSTGKDAINFWYSTSLRVVLTQALIRPTWYSRNHWRCDLHPILNWLSETQSKFIPAWQRANALTMIKLIYNKNTENKLAYLYDSYVYYWKFIRWGFTS